MMRVKHGFTIIELLVAMAVLGTALGLAYGAITTGARQQRLEQSVNDIQGKLRRILEVMSQDVRSSVFGNVGNAPYASNNTSLSFTLLAGGAGYQVLPQNTNNTITAGTISVVGPTATTAPDLANGQVLLLNGAGNAVVFTVTASTLSKNAAGHWNVTYPSSCGTFAYTPNTLAFRVSTLGYTRDAATNALKFRSGGGAAQDLAFDISSFNLTYVYVNEANGTLDRRTDPYMTNNVPQRIWKVTSGSTTTTWTLSQVRVTLTGFTTVNNRRIEQSYQSSIDLGASQSLKVTEVRTCT